MEYMDQQWEMGDLTLYFPRTPVVLGGAQLLAAQDNHPADALIELATQTQAELGLNSSEIDMWFAEPPVDAPVATPTIYLAQKTNPQSALSLPTGKTPTVQRLGVCRYLTQESTQIAPDLDALMYMSHYKDQIVNFRFNPDGTERTDTVVRVLQKPRYGAVVPTGWNETNRHRYEYFVNPNPNQEGDDKFYTGVDSFVLEISAGGVAVQIHYRFGIEVGQSQTYYAEGGERVNNTAVDRYCPKGEMWKISQSSEPDASSSNYAIWQRSAELSALLVNASQALGGFSDLVSTAVGETAGEGLNAQITLDTNAAGHGWYIDPTPLDNTDDYLPTSDASVWQAKAGSAAEGKMDMLSVLLHEYGHALGLEHSGAASDFMAASLQPGVRKLPSAAELTLMARLVAELKGAGGEALTLALSQGERGQVQGESEQDPSNPSSPLPSPSPLSALGLLPLGFMRRNGGKGSASAVVTMGAATASHIDYLTAINPTLANGSFSARQNAAIDQWESVGNVSTTSVTASQVVMLGESTTAQAHLGQAFVLSAQDRFLTFTVSGLNLQTNSTEQNGVFTAAPQDAFEVALQNANTGANLLANGAGGVGNYPF